MIHIALYQPEIAQNVGTIIRTAACFNTQIDLIHPLGFIWNNKYLKRSGMDYLDQVNTIHHDCFEDFINKYLSKRIILVDVHGKTSLWDFEFQINDILLFGRESTGIPDHVKQNIHYQIYIPMAPQARSLNLGVSVGIINAEIKRQLTKS